MSTPEDEWNSVVAALTPEPPDIHAPMPTPGYFTGRIEHIVDRMEMEARRVDSTGGQTSMLMFHYQAAIQTYFQMAGLSVNYFSAFANPPRAVTTKTPPPELDAADVVLD